MEAGVQLSSIGEFGLISRLTGGLATRPDVVLGVGDDAALLDLGDLGGSTLLVATCDAQVAGRHFLLGDASPEEIGHKALAVNLSDIAAMGGEPLWVLISLLLPPTLAVELLVGIYAGMRSLADRYGVAVVGGNVSSTDGPLTLDITALGKLQRDRALRRDGASPGDLVFVSGTLGAAGAGVLAATQQPRQQALNMLELREAHAAAHQAMLLPEPQIRLGQALAASGAVTAMLDISDGFAQDLGHICERSVVGVEIESAAVPVAAAARLLAPLYGRDPLDVALTAGEDYQLIFTVRPGLAAAAQAAAQACSAQITQVGVCAGPDAGRQLQMGDGSRIPLPASGWDHLHQAGTGER